MLFLTRREGQGIWINDNIFIKVLDIVQYRRNSPYQVKLGFEAPSSVEIQREEIYIKIQKEKETNRTKLREKFSDVFSDDVYSYPETHGEDNALPF